MEWQSDSLNELKNYRSLYGDAPTVSPGSTVSASDNQTQVAQRQGFSFDTYKRPEIRTPRGEYDAMAPTTMTASQYLRQKYGDFSSATVVTRPEPVKPQTQIMGTDALTVGDLKLLRNAIDSELLRLQNTRTVSVIVDIKKSQLSALGDNLSDVIGRVERKEIDVEDVAIFPATARQFLKTFRMSEVLPELFDPNGNSPSSIKRALAPAPAPVPVPVYVTATTATPAPLEEEKPNILQWLYKNIQHIKWSLDAKYLAEQAKEREMRESLKEMEKRVLTYSYGNTPMPPGYQSLFLQKIGELKRELKETPE